MRWSNMVLIGYELTQMFEYCIGIFALIKIYPEWRYKTPIWKYLFGIIVFVLGLLNAYNASLALVSTLFVILIGIISAGIFSVFFITNYYEVALLAISYNINIAFFKMSILITRGIIEQENLALVNRGTRCWIEMICCAIIDLVMVIFVIRNEKVLKLLKHLYRKKWRMSVVIIVQWCLLTYNMWLGEQEFHSVDLIVNIALIVSFALLFQCFMLYITHQNGVAEKSMLDTAQSLVETHICELQEIYNYNNQKMHDVKHHMLYLANCLEQKQYTKAQEHIYNYLDGLKGTGKKVWTGFPFLDFIIDYKRGEMEEKGILFSLDIELYEYPLEDAELGVLLGNLLDNAIEAVEKCEEKKEIDLYLRTINQMFMLSLKNTSNQMPQVEADGFVTHKEDKYAHGLGIKNVKRIVDKYQGSITFQYSSEHFMVNIII